MHSRLRSSSTRAALDGAPVVIVAVSPRKFGFSKFDKIRESRGEVNVNVCVNVKGRLGCSLGYGYWTFGVPSGYISGDLLLRFRGPIANEGNSRIYIVVDAHPDLSQREIHGADCVLSHCEWGLPRRPIARNSPVGKTERSENTQRPECHCASACLLSVSPHSPQSVSSRSPPECDQHVDFWGFRFCDERNIPFASV